MQLLSQHGQSDGIRWGDVGWGNHRRRYQYDRLTGAVRLFQIDHRGDCGIREDTCPEHLAAALALVTSERGPA